MAQAKLQDIRLGIADAFWSLTGVNVYRRWPNNIQTPAILIRPERRPLEVSWGDGGLNRYWAIEILADPNDNAQAQDTVDEYLDEDGENSIRALLEADPTLGGAVQNSEYLGWDNYGGRRTEATNFIGAIVNFVTYG